jgi:hypothetical protein
MTSESEMRAIILSLTFYLMACGEYFAGTKGGLLRIAVENRSEAEINLEVSSVLKVEREVESPMSSYVIGADSTGTVLHGFPCRRYGRGSADSVFTFRAGSNFHCSFRAHPGCNEFPIQLRCENEGCTLENLPWPVQCE